MIDGIFHNIIKLKKIFTYIPHTQQELSADFPQASWVDTAISFDRWPSVTCNINPAGAI